MGNNEIDKDAIEAFYELLDKEAEEAGYHLNPDEEIVKDLMEGLLVNEDRYGYRSCPCRLAAGAKLEDLDMVCPCDYRDPDINDYGSCYCGLYISDEVKGGKQKIRVVPERRPVRDERAQIKEQKSGLFGEGEQKNIVNSTGRLSVTYPVWRCRVCGYLCAREAPPNICPICKAKKDRFERFI